MFDICQKKVQFFALLSSGKIIPLFFYFFFKKFERIAFAVRHTSRGERKGAYVQLDEREEKKQLILAQRGNDEAFARLFQANYAFLYKYLVKLCLQPELTEDLVQETMLKAYVHLQSFKGDAKFSTWLISIATRLYIDYERKQKRDLKRFEKLKQEEKRKLIWNVTSNGYEWSEQMDLFARLPSHVRAPILLRHYYGYTFSEIASMLNMKEGTVKSRVHNGLKQIRKEWHNEKT